VTEDGDVVVVNEGEEEEQDGGVKVKGKLPNKEQADADFVINLHAPNAGYRVFETVMNFIMTQLVLAERYARFLIPVFLECHKDVTNRRVDRELEKWLKLISSFATLGTIHRIKEVVDMANILLELPHNTLQVAAMGVIVKMEKPLGKYGKSLEMVCSGKHVRDGLLEMNLDKIEEFSVRKRLTNLLTRALAPKILQRCRGQHLGKSGKKPLKIILDFAGKFSLQEKDELVKLLFKDVLVPGAALVSGKGEALTFSPRAVAADDQDGLIAVLRIAQLCLNAWRNESIVYVELFMLCLRDGLGHENQAIVAEAVRFLTQMQTIFRHETVDEDDEDVEDEEDVRDGGGPHQRPVAMSDEEDKIRYVGYCDYSLIIPNLVKASRVPLATLAQDCREYGPSLWLKLILEASRTNALDQFFRSSGAFHAILECLERVTYSNLEVHTVSAALEIVSNLVPENRKSRTLDISRFTDVVIPLIDLVFDYLERAVKEQGQKFFGSAKKLVQNQLAILMRLVPFLEKTHAGRMMKVLLPTIVASVGSLGKPLGQSRVQEGEGEEEAEDGEEKEEEGANNNNNDVDVTARAEQDFLCGMDLMQGLVPNAGSADFLSLLPGVLDLIFVVGNHRGLCVRLCTLLKCFADSHHDVSHLLPFVSALVNMLSFSQVVIGEMDVNRRLMGLEKTAQLVAELGDSTIEQEAPPFLLLLYPLLYLSASSDLSLRDQSVAVCLDLLTRAHQVHGQTHPPFVEQLVMPWMRRVLCSATRPVLHSAMMVVRHCAIEAPGRYPDLARLVSNDDPSKDYFLLSFELALPARERALKVLRKSLKQEEYSSTTLAQFFLPLYKHCLFFVFGKEDAQKRYRKELIHTMQTLGKRLPWSEWAKTMNYFGKKWDEAITLRQEESGCLNLFCSMVESFHFKEGGYNVAFMEEVILGRLNKNILQRKEERFRKKMKSIKKKDASKGSRINIRVVVVMVKLLQILTEEVMSTYLPPLLRSVCNSLAEQDESIRDATRKTLALVAVSLGPKYFGPIITGLRSALRRGFEVHVLYYSLHYIFSAMQESLEKNSGVIDRLAGPISALLLEDILGLTATKKEVAQLQAKFKECRTTKSFHTFTLLARFVTFPNESWERAAAFQEFMQPVVDMLQFSKRKKDLKRLRDVFDRILTGLTENSSASIPALLLYSLNLASENMGEGQRTFGERQVARANIHKAAIAPVEEMRRKTLLKMREETERSKFVLEKTKREDYNEQVETQDNFAINKVLLVEFGLKILLAMLQKMKSSTDREVAGAAINPFVPLCARGLQQENDDVVTLSLECLRRMLRWSGVVPNLPGLINELANQSLAVLQRTDPNLPLGRACFMFVTAVSKRADVSHWSMSDEDGKFLLELVLQEIDAMRDFRSCFTLLQGMVARKVMSTHLYDIMERMRRLAVTHQESHVRQQCASILVKFLVVYPMTDAKRQVHLNKILRDLSYEEPTGREAALELLNTVFLKFPEELLSSFAEVFFVPLIVRLANESDRRVRLMCGAAMKVFLEKIKSQTVSELFGTCLKWYRVEEKSSMQVAAAQTFGMFADMSGVSKIDRRMAMKTLEEGLASFFETYQPGQFDDWLLSEAEQLQRHALQDSFLYQTLHALEKFVVSDGTKGGAANSSKSLSLSQETFCKCLVYPHAWVRATTSRILENLASRNLLAHWQEVEGFRETIFSVLEQMEDEVGPELVPVIESLLKNVLYSLQVVMDKAQMRNVQQSNTPSPATRRKRRLVVADADDEEDSVQVDEDITEEGPVGIVLDRLSSIAMDCHSLLKSGIFKFFVALLLKLDAREAAKYLAVVLKPLYRAAPWDREARGELAVLCQQVLGALKGHVGVSVFSQVANEVREKASSSGRQTKSVDAAQFVVNPVSANAKKLKQLKKTKKK
jgi:hypothetical protein